MSISIRPALIEDAPEIATLSGQLGYPTETQDMAGRLRGLLARPDHQVLVAVKEAGPLLGWAHCYLRRLVMLDRHAELGGLVVAEGVRGQGIGAALLDAVETWAGVQGAALMIVRSNQIREQAHHFYLQLGYELVKHSMVFHKNLD